MSRWLRFVVGIAAVLALFLIVMVPAYAVRTLTVISPNGGEWYEPGDTVQIRWSASGDSWQASDTVKIEYSDDGSLWSKASGGTRLPYNQGSFSWSTMKESKSYRIRITSNDDAAVVDTSNSGFHVWPDITAPTINHAALTYTSVTPGPYQVLAVAKDGFGLASVRLYWKKNSGAFTYLTMNPTGNPDEFSAYLPGPSVIGDTYSYYIEATDRSKAAYVTTFPSTGAAEPCSFNIGLCGADTVTDVGGSTFGPVSITRGNVFKCSVDTTLTKIEQHMGIDSPSELRFLVYESYTPNGSYQKIHDSVISPTGTGSGWFSSGTISVDLFKDRYYIIAVGSPYMHRYASGWGYGLPRVAFGSYYGSWSTLTYPPPATTSTVAGGFAWSQRLSSCRRLGTFTITAPNGGEAFDPGQTITVQWNASGGGWLPSDTVRLEYSFDGGSTWNSIPGASSLPASSGLFNWNTAGLAIGEHYRVRVVYNIDNTILDASDGDFALRPDTTPPVITHPPLADARDAAGPYTVTATVTDNTGISSVQLHYIKNGGAYSSVPMTPTGAANQFTGQIPGPSNVSDVYCYYIEAKDASQAQNVAREPAGAPSAAHCFKVLSCASDVVGDASWATQSTQYASRANLYYCRKATVLNQIEEYLNVAASPANLHFFVYESTTPDGPYAVVFEYQVLVSNGGVKWYSSGPVSVPLNLGRYYQIGVGSFTWILYYGMPWGGASIPTSFGEMTGSRKGPFPPAPEGMAGDSTAWYQRISSCLVSRALHLSNPNTSAWFEQPTNIHVCWDYSGPDWAPGDTVKLEYSADSGSTWNQIAGAESIAYYSGAFDWSTAGLPDSTQYRVRVTCNADPSVTDSNDIDFRIETDVTPPVITHTPLTDIGDGPGPFTVRAVVTDNHVLGYVRLYWNKNGGTYTLVDMTSTGQPGEFQGDIPGPGTPGDVYSYYIEAQDISTAHNTSTYPSTGAVSFSINTCHMETLGHSIYSYPAGALAKGNVFQCTTSGELKQIDRYLQLPGQMELKFFVYESPTLDGTYAKVFENTTASAGPGTSWYSSGPISVQLKYGCYYVIGAGWGSNAFSYYDNQSAASAAFGPVLRYWQASYPPAATTTTQQGYAVDYQRYTFCATPRYIQIAQPNGGERFEPSNSVEIKWLTTGPSWVASDTVKLEYSSDSGATWAPIPGAESIPYTSGIYTWNTTGASDSDHYRVRAVFNGDDSVNDASDVDFGIVTDNVPPVVSTNPLRSTSLTYARTVWATATDDYGVASVTLFWSKNGSEFTPADMTRNYTTDHYYSGIPGGVLGDVFRYFIEAKDKSLTGNVGRTPIYEYQIIPQRDYFTENYNCNLTSFNLANTSITFTPDSSWSRYTACRKYISTLPTDPTGGNVLSLTPNSFQQVTLSGPAMVWLYGQSRNTFFVGSNGCITFDSGDALTTQYLSTTEHFKKLRISSFYSPLNPSTGTISWKQLEDRVAVTFQNVSQAAMANSQTFQMELFYDGRITLSYLRMDATLTNWIVGLSEGYGQPDDFKTSDLSHYGFCSLASASVIDSIAPVTDLQMPFGSVNVGSSSAGSVTVTNGGGGGDLKIDGVRLAQYTEDFNSGAAPGWQEDADADWSVTTNGEYQAYVASPTSYNSLIATHSGAVFEDAYLETRVRRPQGFTSGPPVHLILRATPDFRVNQPRGTGYCASIDNGGYYYIYRIQNGVRTTLASGTSNPYYIGYGSDWQKLAFSAEWNTLNFYVNGQLIRTVSDPSISSGRVGLGGERNIQSGYTYQFDDVFVTSPTSAGATANVQGFKLQGTPTFPAYVQPGQSMTFNLTYAPFVSGTSSAILKIDCNGGDAAAYKLALSGSAPPTPSISAVKLLQNGAPVTLTGKRVSAAFPNSNRCYIQDEDRASGICVVYTSGQANLKPGDVINVTGHIYLSSPEKTIAPNAPLTFTPSGPAPKPLGMTNEQVAGGDFGMPYGQPGAWGGWGVNNVCMLVRTTGKIIGTGGGVLVIDDGSKLLTGDGVLRGGLIVRYPYGGFSIGQTVAVTGISSLYQAPSGHLERQIVTRNQWDVVRVF